MKRTTFKVSFFLKRVAAKKSGKMPIIARIACDSQIAQFNTKISIFESQWVNEKNCVSPKSKEGKEINEFLNAIRTRITNIYQEQQQKGGEITAERLKCLFFGLDSSQETLLKAFKRMNEEVRQLVDIDVTIYTYNTYELARQRVREFLKIKYGLSDIAMRELSLNFINEYEVFLKAHYGISHNVAAKMILFLKKVVTNAFNNGSIRANPFANYSIRRTKVDVGYLTKEELAAIRNKKITIRRLEHLRDAFLFCCYTGLSYIDVKKLTKRDLRINDEGEMWISIKRQKTDTAVNVLVLDVARALVEKYDGRLDNDLVLPVPSNQKCNAYLKELADICYIDKKLTFHTAKHTATWSCLIINELRWLCA